ncbi:glycosyltransferase [Robertmurraya massiliosenegalensis]|uniref:glycosyltransferase n=1 Tax=Robertmurraya TaxID=2837507 RepID=UPI0039A6C883
MSDVKVTIAIPVYNAAGFIEDCLDSILKQTMQQENIEIILVNDGSKDNSKEILDRYALENPNVRVFHQENSGGPGKPRNVAIENAKGEYIFFVDADDYLGVEALERMYKMGKENGTDVILGKLVGVGGRGVAKSMFQFNQPKTDIFSSNIVYTLSPQKMIKRELMIKNSIRFPEGAATAEDQPFMLKVYILADGISVVADYPCYYLAHHENNEHASTMGVAPKKFYEVIGEAIEVIKTYVNDQEKKEQLLVTYFKRHFDFSRTKSFMTTNVSLETKLEWQTELQEFLDDHLDIYIENQLPPKMRVFLFLVRNAGIEELIRWRSIEKSLVGKVEDGRIKIDASIIEGTSIPEDLLDFTEENKIQYIVQSIDWDGKFICLKGYLYHSLITSEHQQIIAIWKNRKTSEELSEEVNCFDLEQSTLKQFSVPTHATINSGYEMKWNTENLLESNDSFGPWDLFFELNTNGYKKRVRIGSKRRDTVPNTFKFALIGDGDTPVRPYYTANYHNLSIDLGETVNTFADIELKTAYWESDHELIFTSMVDLDRLLLDKAVSPEFKLVIKERDKERKFIYDLTTSQSEERKYVVEKMLDLNTCAEGMRIPKGTWDFSIQILIGNYDRTIRFGYKKTDASKKIVKTLSFKDSPIQVKGYFTKPYGNLSLIVSEEPEKKSEEEEVVQKKVSLLSKIKRKLKQYLK